jgi:hypothetical protein
LTVVVGVHRQAQRECWRTKGNDSIEIIDRIWVTEAYLSVGVPIVVGLRIMEHVEARHAYVQVIMPMCIPIGIHRVWLTSGLEMSVDCARWRSLTGLTRVLMSIDRTEQRRCDRGFYQ